MLLGPLYILSIATTLKSSVKPIMCLVFGMWTCQLPF